jgi:hypothetical protein
MQFAVAVAVAVAAAAVAVAVAEYGPGVEPLAADATSPRRWMFTLWI